MRQANLCLHSGANAASREQVSAVLTPSRTETWVPISHERLLTGVQQSLERSGLHVVTESYGLTHDCCRYFGLLQVANGSNAWQRAFREGFAPLLTTDGLRSLAKALERDDPRLITCATVYPPALAFCGDEPVERCCPLAWAVLDGHSLNAATPTLLDARFSELCFKADALLGEPAAVRYLLNEIDTWDRDTMRRNLLGEVERTLAERTSPKQEFDCNAEVT
jgi:hypothetical protein